MSTNQTKPKPRARTVEEWREIRKERYRNGGKSGGFRILPRQVLYSDAFNELSKSAKIALILSLDQIDQWQKKKHRGQSYRESSVGKLRNDGRFSQPNNLIKEMGIKSPSTIANVRKELIAAGFWEVVKAGSLYNTGIFRWSDEWLRYEQKPKDSCKVLRTSAQQPGYCHYPNIVLYNDARQASAAAHEGTHASDASLPEDLPVQLNLFAELAGDDGDTEDQGYDAAVV